MKGLAAPRLADDRLGLVEPPLRLPVGNAETLVIVYVIGSAAAEPDDKPSFTEVTDQRELLGEADRMMQRGLDDGKADRAAPRRGREGGGKADRIDIGADAGDCQEFRARQGGSTG